MALDYVEANGIASQASYPYVSTNITDQVEEFLCLMNIYFKIFHSIFLFKACNL